MCGNGKSCEECNRGPCGPTYEKPSREDYAKKDICYACGGDGRELVKIDIGRHVYNECRICNGTGKARKFTGRYSAVAKINLSKYLTVHADSKKEAEKKFKKLLKKTFGELHSNFDLKDVQQLWSAE